jgi:hypothetical protein
VHVSSRGAYTTFAGLSNTYQVVGCNFGKKFMSVAGGIALSRMADFLPFFKWGAGKRGRWRVVF